MFQHRLPRAGDNSSATPQSRESVPVQDLPARRAIPATHPVMRRLCAGSGSQRRRRLAALPSSRRRRLSQRGRNGSLLGTGRAPGWTRDRRPAWGVTRCCSSRRRNSERCRYYACIQAKAALQVLSWRLELCGRWDCRWIATQCSEDQLAPRCQRVSDPRLTPEPAVPLAIPVHVPDALSTRNAAVLCRGAPFR